MEEILTPSSLFCCSITRDQRPPDGSLHLLGSCALQPSQCPCTLEHLAVVTTAGCTSMVCTPPKQLLAVRALACIVDAQHSFSLPDIPTRDPVHHIPIVAAPIRGDRGTQSSSSARTRWPCPFWPRSVAAPCTTPIPGTLA
jgi:hypothetical protein